jgi:uncharacterized membrane protein YedE/YeeE
VSSILENAIGAQGPDRMWRIAFIAGLLGAGVFAAAVLPGAVHFHMEAGYARAIAAGLLVGIGTQLGSGCTSGHGVCGISRLSLRSIAATAIFMGAGVLVVFITRHLL